MLIKKPEEIKILREGGKLLAGIVAEVARRVAPGVTAVELDDLADTLIQKVNGKPSFKGFNGYPNASCISVNDGLVHGIPKKDLVIKKGDIVSVDIGLKYKNLFTDMAVTVPVGSIPKKTQTLLKVTKRSLEVAIETAKPGRTIGDIGHAVQKYIEKHGFSVVRSLVGHGVGHAVHEEPRIPNFGRGGEGPKIEKGMVLAFEPMVTLGGPDVVTKADGWTVATADHSLSAHYEHTVAITESGCMILTKE